MKNITVFGEKIIDGKTIIQLNNCLLEDSIGVLTPDAHYGYNHPIGGAVAYKNHISLSGVGFDIGCGNKAVKTNIRASEIKVSKVMTEIFNQISFGVGQKNNDKPQHEVFDLIDKADYKPARKLLNLAKEQLGTVGSGNHFIDLFKDEEDYLWIGVHFGSRGFGHSITSGFISLAKGEEFEKRINEGSMDSPPILFELNSELGIDYFSSMNIAGEYAYAGRNIVVNKVLKILDNPEVLFEVHNHHNFAWTEKHNDEDYCVVRKGCTPAFPGQYGFIGANMFDNSVIIKGVEHEDSKKALYSTVHGAGRIMSRTQAAGKKKWQKNEKGIKVPVRISEGLVNFDNVKQRMRENNIVLKGAGADEAPECYKKLTEVLGYMSNNIEILHTLTPIGVAMAGEETFDPYKD